MLMIFLLMLLVPCDVRAQDWRTVLNLRGTWKFELGDKAKWADPRFRDSDWDEISVPSSWEDQGYPGYDGYAWYRKHFTIGNDLRGRHLYLRVGYVDDASEVYLNGHLVGFEGRFPPQFMTAYNISREYVIPQQYLNFGGENLIAVRVYDQRLGGGITHGSVGIFERRDYLEPDLDLSGRWKFKRGDDLSWKNPQIPREKWQDVLVPSYWELQGSAAYDGFAWYRTTFVVPKDLEGKTLVLLLGRIDDVDETYLNGKLLGRTGRMQEDWTSLDWGQDYTRQRAYVIPSDLLDPGQVNTIAVRVLDVFMHGGIYDGPVGLVTRSKYRAWERDHQDRWNILDLFR
jgi:sialate O-acetylesterase